MATDSRWPRWVYGAGEEPDYRFSFANERTYLAWVRTALALLAGGVALHAVTDLPHRSAAASLVIVLSMAAAGLGFFRWAAAERAMRRSRPLHGFGAVASLALGVLVVSVVMLVVVLAS